MQLVSKRELAKFWKLDVRNSIFKKLIPAHQLRVGNGKIRSLFAFDESLTPVLMLDFNRVLRCKTDLSKAGLIKRLESEHGQGWYEKLEKLLTDN